MGIENKRAVTNRPEILDLWLAEYNRATWDVTLRVRTYETIQRDPVFTPGGHDEYRLNLTDLLRTSPEPTEDERYEYHERKMVEHTEQVERLRPGAEPRRDEAVRHDDYPTEPCSLGNPYRRCVHCGATDPEINGRLDGHRSYCEWRRERERPGADTGAIVARKTESRLNAEDVARLRGAFGEWMRDRLGDDEMADAIRTVLAKLEGR